MKPSDQEVLSGAPNVTAITISEISAAGLPKLGVFRRSPNPYIVIEVDGVKNRTATSPSSPSPTWTDVFHFTPSSATPIAIRIEVFHEATGKHSYKPECIGSFAGKLGDFKVNTLKDLKRDGVLSGRFKLKLEYDHQSNRPPGPAPTSSAELEAANAAAEHALNASKSLDSPNSLSAQVSKIGDGADTASTSKPILSSMYDDLQLLGPVVSPIGQALKSLDQIVNIIEGVAEVHPICKVAAGLLLSVYKALRNQTGQDDTVRELGIGLRDMLSFANEASDLEQISGGLDVIKEMGLAVQEGAKLIEDYMASPFFLRAAKSAISSKMANRIQTSKQRFAYLNEQFDRIIGLQAWKMAKSKDRRELLQNLPSVPKLKVGYDRIPECLPGTRVEVQAEVLKLLRNTEPNQPSIVWINGVAGTGKSTVAATIAHTLADSQNLGGSFFFSRNGDAEQVNPELLFATLARGLATKVPRLSPGILDVLKSDAQIGSSAISTQFTSLILRPLMWTRDLHLPVVLVVDGLDECTGASDILSVIAKDVSRLPPTFKFLITSRPEPDLTDIFDDIKGSVHPISLNGDCHVDRDITLFVNANMPRLARRFSLDADWPGTDDCGALVTKAAGLFIWISTAIKFIGDQEVQDPEGRLKVVLDCEPGTPHSGTHLDYLYLQVLKQAWGTKVAEIRLQLFQKVVGIIVSLRSPLTATAIGLFISEDTAAPRAVVQTVRKLQSVLVVPTTASEPIQIIHPSFVEFITSADRCIDERFLIQTTTHQRAIVCQSLRLIHQYLNKHNICGIESSLLNSEIKDLDERISRNIPEALQYSCIFWADHLSLIPFDAEVCSLLKVFYCNDLLRWLEVASLLGVVRTAITALDIAYEWLLCNPTADKDVVTLANDSQRFTKEFREPITQSALHVYISAVPFTPKNTLLYKTYALKLMDARVRVLRGVSSQWTACLHVLEGGMESGPIHSAIFSPEGRRIVAQYDSGFLRLWDTKTGFPLGQVAEGYSHHRQTAPHRYPTVLFSPTGKRIVSYYRTLSLWNGLNLEAVSKSLEGHEGAVTTAAISPDGVCIASGSEDRTIRLWRGSDGSPMGNVMKGHDGRINTVAFSPDGVMILSSSDDRTICIWSVSDQSLINKYPTGYTAEGVRAYPSPNGARIISTCDDGSIRLWDMLSGTIVAERRSNSPPDSGLTQRSPFSSGGFSGVPGSSSSRWVAPPPVFSSDGSRIVVASNRANRELELLDGMTGSPIGKPFVGHTDTVKFLSLSLDGKIIVSSTGSSTVRVWDVITGKPVGVDLGGHIDHVTSVSVSPNGQRLLSSSEDGTVRVWDATLRDPATEEAYRRSWVSPHMAAPSDPPLVVISGTGLQVAFVQVASVRSTLKLINATPSESSRETYPGSHDAVALSSHGRFLLTTSHEKPQSGLQSLYSLGKPKPTVYTTTLFHLGHQPVPENLGWKDRIVVPTDNSHIVKVAFSCDEKMMVLCSHPASLQLWDVAKCAPVGPVFGSDIPSHIVSVAFSPDGSRLAFALNDYTVRVWDTAAFIQIRQPLLTFKSVYSEVRFSPDGRFLVAWARDLRRCWNVQSLTEVDNDKVTIAAGIMGLKSEFGGWVESVDGRKLWWTPALNRGSFSDTTSHGHLVTNGSTGRLTVVDGTKIVEAERRRVTQSV